MNKCKLLKYVFIFCIISLFASKAVFAENTTGILELVPAVNNSEVTVLIKYKCENMCGGGFNFIYDNTKLEFIEAVEEESIKSTTHFVNPKFGENSVRVNWVSTSVMPVEGSVLTVSFKLINGSFEKNSISVEKLKFADENSEKIDSEYKIVYDESSQNTTPSSGSSGGSGFVKKKPSVTTQTKEENEPVTEDLKRSFADVKENDWFYDCIMYAVENKLMNGMSETEFLPSYTLTRAMLVTVLYRNEGEPAVNKSVPFSDIKSDAYYTDAVLWAKQNGIVNGMTENKFAPDNNITREQLATIIFRYAQYKNYDVSVGENTNITSYDDIQSVSEYAVASMQYAVGRGLMKGRTDTTLNPKDNATRAETAAILQRFIENNRG